MPEETVQYTIGGMTCGHCVYKIECEIGDLSGVTNAKVDLEKKLGTFTFDPAVIKAQAIKDKIIELKFTAN